MIEFYCYLFAHFSHTACFYQMDNLTFQRVTYCKQTNIKIHGSQAVYWNFYFLNNRSGKWRNRCEHDNL